MPFSFQPSQRMIAGAFMAVGAVVLFAWGIPGLIEASQSYAWPVSIGTIQECAVTADPVSRFFQQIKNLFKNNSG